MFRRSGSWTALHIAGIMMMAMFVAHCGDADVRVTTGGGVSPSPGTFAGTTGDGGSIVIEVGSIESISLECDDQTLTTHFNPPGKINSDGTFDVTVNDGGKRVRVRGTFGSNSSVQGTLDDRDDACDTSFEASRQGGVNPTSTPVTGRTPTPSGATPTPVPSGEPTSTSGETGEPTPMSTSTPSMACPTRFDFLGTAGNLPVLDPGWTGQSHDSTVVDRGKLTFNLSCAAETKPCGTCTISGPIANVNAADYTAMTGSDINAQRCTGNTRITCTSNGDCSGNGTCAFFFGTYLPLSAGGVSTCVGNRVTGTITGTANIEQGSGASTVNLISQVFSGPTADQPCPKCVGDTTPNDGKRQGTCSAGNNSGQMCDVNGSSPNSFFGATSLDCPPLSGGSIASLPIDLTNTTGTATKTLTAESPSCRAPGFTTLKCFCDVCQGPSKFPCTKNADCVAAGDGTICGGSSGSGTGFATKPNDCDDAVCSSGGVCEAGPFEQFCGPTATFKACGSDAECAQFSGNTCSIGKFRACFTDNGVVGASITAQGQPDPPNANGEADPTIAALFCIGPTSASGVNTVAGLPGPGRVELPGHARQLP